MHSAALDFSGAKTLTVASRSDVRPLTAALLGSLLAHALLIVALVGGVVGSPPNTTTFDATALRATLAPVAPTIIEARRSAPASLDPIVHEPIRERLAAAPVIKGPTSLLPNPFPPKSEAVEPSTSMGRVTITPINEPLDPMFEQVLSQLYPNAERSDIKFEVAPSGRYPSQAVKDRRQAHLRVLVIVRADGVVQLAEGSLHDPMFTSAVRAALREAKATPLEGNPFQLRWTTLMFMFEFTGDADVRK